MQRPSRFLDRTNTMTREKRGLDPSDGKEAQQEPKKQKVPALASVIVEALKVDSLQKLCLSLEPILRRVKHRSDDVSENLKHKDGQEQDDSMPENGGNQGSPSKKRKTAPIKKNSTSKSVTNKGGYVSQSSTSKSKSQGLSDPSTSSHRIN